MKVGDLVVIASNRFFNREEIGLVVDELYNDSDFTQYFQVKWDHELEWWAEYELVAVDKKS